MNPEIRLVDRGRGLQLSTSRITVQDLVPYFRAGFSYEEIRRWMPTLSEDEIRTVEDHYQVHKLELDEEDRHVNEYREEQIRKQREQFPEEDPAVISARIRRVVEQRRRELTGAGNSGGCECGGPDPIPSQLDAESRVD